MRINIFPPIRNKCELSVAKECCMSKKDPDDVTLVCARLLTHGGTVNWCEEKEKAYRGTVSTAEEPGMLSGCVNVSAAHIAALIAAGANMKNICTNPAARPREDQSCHQPSGPSGSGPQPVPNIYMTDGLMIFDGLWLRGTGIKGLR
jgi:hypothetical protein